MEESKSSPAVPAEFVEAFRRAMLPFQAALHELEAAFHAELGAGRDPLATAERFCIERLDLIADVCDRGLRGVGFTIPIIRQVLASAENETVQILSGFRPDVRERISARVTAHVLRRIAALEREEYVRNPIVAPAPADQTPRLPVVSRQPTSEVIEPQRAAGPCERHPADSGCRCREVDAYLSEIRAATGRRPTRKSTFWQWCRYKDHSEFNRWQSNHPRTTHEAAHRFDRILREKPHLANDA